MQVLHDLAVMQIDSARRGTLRRLDAKNWKRVRVAMYEAIRTALDLHQNLLALPPVHGEPEVWDEADPSDGIPGNRTQFGRR